MSIPTMKVARAAQMPRTTAPSAIPAATRSGRAAQTFRLWFWAIPRQLGSGYRDSSIFVSSGGCPDARDPSVRATAFRSAQSVAVMCGVDLRELRAKEQNCAE